MPEQREPIIIKDTGEVTTEDTAQKALEELIASRIKPYADLKVQLVERGSVQTALQVTLPSHLHGEWVRNTPENLRNKRDRGFEIDTVFAAKQGMHDANADGSVVVGDLIHMVTTRANKENIDRVWDFEMRMRHGAPGEINALQNEERKFLEDQQGLGNIGSTNNSRAVPVGIKP